MVEKEFTFRGKKLEELKAMSIEQFAELCNSRSRRNLLKGVDKQFLEKLDKARNNPRAKPVRTHKRDMVVIPQMLGTKIAIHRGNTFESIDVVPKMLGHYVGELVLTRKRLTHGKAGIGATKSSTAVTARG
ncbi:MAG: 30S ribosomal protein S19 [archaeon]